jgi:C4-dicarboxylate transporter DctM subunit
MIFVLFGALALLLLMGIPVSFSIGISTTLAILFEGSLPTVIIAQKMVDGLNSFTLMALPMFILSGAIMIYGSTPRIMALINMLLRKKPWGIGSASVYGCAAFGTISGSGVATTAAIGSIMAPEMAKKGYSRGFTAPLIAASGTLGGVIPPSIGFVVYAQIANVSISDMFMAGIIPGVLTAYLLATLNKFMVKKHNWVTEGTDYYSQVTGSEKMKIFLNALLPIFMPIFILVGVISGIVTPTEAASVSIVYAFILATFVYKELSFKKLFEVVKNSVINSSTILIIISFATPFAYLITNKNIANIIADWIFSISGNLILVYGFIIIILLILGTFMESLSLILLTTPMFLPILITLGVDPIAYGITSGLALGIGAVTPPLAVTLFTACRILKIRVEDTFPWVFYVCLTMLIGCVLTAVFPILSTFLPSILK